jgi:hypothetical protein
VSAGIWAPRERRDAHSSEYDLAIICMPIRECSKLLRLAEIILQSNGLQSHIRTIVDL